MSNIIHMPDWKITSSIKLKGNKEMGEHMPRAERKMSYILQNLAQTKRIEGDMFLKESISSNNNSISNNGVSH